MEAKLGAEQKPKTPNEGLYFEDVVLGLIDSGGSRATMKEIIYALTLERKVSSGVFKDISNGLKAIEAKGRIISDRRGKYYDYEAYSSGKQKQAGSPNKTQRQKIRSGKVSRLNKMMAEEFGPPKMTVAGRRKRRQNPRIHGR